MSIHITKLMFKKQYIGQDLHPKTILTPSQYQPYQTRTGTKTSHHTSPFPDTHVIAYFRADTITYDKPTILPEMNKLRIEPTTIHILCIHHLNQNIGILNKCKN